MKKFKKIIPILTAVLMLFAAVPVNAAEIVDEFDTAKPILLENEDFSGVITKCTKCDTYTVNLVCTGVYHETLSTPRTCSTHDNCQITIEQAYATGSCTQCNTYFVQVHNEYYVHSSNGNRVRCCSYY